MKSWFCRHKWQFPCIAKLVRTFDSTPVGYKSSVLCTKCFKVKSKTFVAEAHAEQWLKSMVNNDEN